MEMGRFRVLFCFTPSDNEMSPNIANAFLFKGSKGCQVLCICNRPVQKHFEHPPPTSVNRFSPNSRRQFPTDHPSVLRHAGNLGNNCICESPVGTPEERPHFCTMSVAISFPPRQFFLGVWLEIRGKDYKRDARICISAEKGQSSRRDGFCPDMRDGNIAKAKAHGLCYTLLDL